MIPHTIHYCWFGRNPKPKLAKKCIKSWKKYCKNYQIIEWNEDNFDISSCPLYVREAYEAKKWAFVTDYVRLKIVYDHGGIYFDTDVELLKKIDALLEHQAWFGFQGGKLVATGLGFGAIKGHSILAEIMEQYNNLPFILSDGGYDLTPCPTRNTLVFINKGLQQDDSMQLLENDTLILPTVYLCPIDCKTGQYTKSYDTISIHHFSASWFSQEEKEKQLKLQRKIRIDKIVHFPNRCAKKIMGGKYEVIKTVIKKKHN